MAELADAQDLESCGQRPCGFDPHFRHHFCWGSAGVREPGLTVNQASMCLVGANPTFPTIGLVAELVDARDLKSLAFGVWVRLPPGPPVLCSGSQVVKASVL